MKSQRVLLLGNYTKPGVTDAMATAEACLKGWARSARRNLSENVEDERVKADFGLVFGGDGAILAAARRVARAGVPLLGVNLGKLGFLAEINPAEIAAVLQRLKRRLPKPVERMMLQVEIRRKGKLIRRCAVVNDAVISREALSRIIEIKLFIDDEKVNTFGGDGLICSTCVGSTAHNLAAGGPIVAPHTQAIMITPVCPHTLSNRPLVVNSDSVIELEVSSRSTRVAMTADGQIMVKLKNGDRVRIRRNPWPLKLLKVSQRSFFETLRSKLNWEGSFKHA